MNGTDPGSRVADGGALHAVHRLFNDPTLRRVLLRGRVVIGLLAAAAVLWWMDPAWLWSGFAISMVGELIQLWCFAVLDKRRTVAGDGPYAFVRNPMYLGRFLLVLGALLLLGRWWLIAVFAVGYWFYMVNRVRREEAWLRSALGAPYEEYVRTVRRFVPGRPRQGATILRWDGRLFAKNHGALNLAGALLFWAAAWTRADLLGG